MCFEMYSQDYNGYLFDLKHWQSFNFTSHGNEISNPYNA